MCWLVKYGYCRHPHAVRAETECVCKRCEYVYLEETPKCEYCLLFDKTWDPTNFPTSRDRDMALVYAVRKLVGDSNLVFWLHGICGDSKEVPEDIKCRNYPLVYCYYDKGNEIFSPKTFVQAADSVDWFDRLFLNPAMVMYIRDPRDPMTVPKVEEDMIRNIYLGKPLDAKE